MDSLKIEEGKLDLELEESKGDYEKMKSALEKKIDLYKRFLQKDGLTELDRLRLENKREWQQSHLLSLIIPEEQDRRTIQRLSATTEKIDCCITEVL